MKSISNKLYSFIIALTIAFGFFEGCSVEPTNIRLGVFVDSPVEGLMYQAGQIQGRTDPEGTFYYEKGDSIFFSIEGVVIGEAVLAKEIITPIDLVSDLDSFVTHPKVTNIARFLQSLDDDLDPENGIRLSTETRERVKNTFSSIDFSPENFDSQVDSFFMDENGVSSLRSSDKAQAHFFSTMASRKILPVDLIFLGDGLTNGTQSTSVRVHDSTDSKDANVHKDTQIHGYAQLLADQIQSVASSDFEWNNPLLKMDSGRIKTRILTDVTPYNLAVHGATVADLLGETISDNPILNEVTKPIPGADLTQLDAAKFVASQTGHENRMKLFILWIGMENVLGAITDSGGKKLTQPDITTFLSDPDLDSIKTDLTDIVDALRKIEYSYVFVATIPDITRTGALLYKEDLQALAKFSSPNIDPLSVYVASLPQNNEVIAIGFQGFDKIGTDLTSNNDQMNGAISDLLDEETLSNNEAALIQTRIGEINGLIDEITEKNSNVFLVDMNKMFEDLYKVGGSIALPNEAGSIKRGYGQGFFSMDGIYPSHTGYALISREFLKKINDPDGNTETGDLGISVDLTEFDQTIETIWASDPYRDQDQDGFPNGPGPTAATGQEIIDTSLERFTDCDDEDANILPEILTGNSCP